ncbi:MAG: aminomethyl-transferring glycine dehydrogenase subunit GcvPA [Alphaproteobacteria bacterium]|nr:aminomethyl-transferring glycine dehydrogenase subunit GcvPA [Alphaproteobacteria bacterium]
MRYLPQTKNSRAAMLEAVGASSIDDLYRDIPKSAFVDGKLNLPDHKGELEVERILGGYANENLSAANVPFFLGAGVYYHHIPSTVDHVIQRSEYLTAYTPYQPEIAQGTLQALFEFQTFVAKLTGQEVANASMYDGATATAEAALMAMRVTKRKKIVVGNALHPDYRAVLKTYLGNFEGCALTDGEPDNETACVIVQSPDFYGAPHKYETFRKICNETGALLVVVVNEIVSLGLLPAPVEADIVCGEAQSIGVAMSFGGPHLGFFACREKFIRQMPGRLCGMTEDADGKRGFVLTLSTREQHIRREKATSNICTNQGLCALAFTVHMSLLGENGFKRLARLNHEAACKLADAVVKVSGVSVRNECFFNEFAVDLPKPSKDVVEALAQRGIVGGYALEGNGLLLCATEMTTDEDIAALVSALKEVLV